jgi:hypothetical protein
VLTGPNSQTSRLSRAILIALLAAAVLALSWPRLQAGFRYLPVDIAIDRFYADREIPSDRLTVLIRFAGQAINYHDHYRYHDGLSLLHYLRGLDRYTPALERRDAYRQAALEAIEALKRAPSQPDTWLRLAAVRSVLRDDAEAIIEPWKMSIFTGRTHSTLLSPRVGIGLSQLQFMDRESSAMLRDQLLLAWELKPNELLQVLRRRDPGLHKTRALVGGTDPAALGEMEARLE